MWELNALSEQQIDRCMNTVSSNAFYLMVGDALSSGKNLSVVRMADGEKSLMELCNTGNPNDIITASEKFNQQWVSQFGVDGITRAELKKRLVYAATKCDYFAPSISGIVMPNYFTDDYSPRVRYVDNFFPNAWSEDMKINLYKKAGHILFIHRNTSTADAIQIRAKYVLGVKVTYLKLCHWSESYDVIEKANKIDAPLTLFSGGAASKFIGAAIAHGGNIPKVTLDIGQAADRWTLLSLKDKANEIRFKK